MNYVEFNSKLGIKLHPQWLDNKTISDIFNLLFDKNVYIEYQFFPQSAQFIVHKDRILAHSLDFYKGFMIMLFHHIVYYLQLINIKQKLVLLFLNHIGIIFLEY